MAFNNPILAGESLVRTGIKSVNYQEGNAGWRIGKNGDAELNDAYFRGETSGESASYNTVYANNELYYQGDELTTIINGVSGGQLSWGEIPAAEYSTLSELELVEISAELTDGRSYYVSLSPLRCTAAIGGGNVRFDIAWTKDGREPTSSDNDEKIVISEKIIAEANNYETVSGSRKVFTRGVSGTYRFLLIMVSVDTDSVSCNYDPPRFGVWDYGPDTLNNGTDRTGTNSSKTVHSFDSGIVYSESYNGDGSLFNSDAEMYQGESPYAPENGNMSSFGRLPQTELDGMVNVPRADYEYLELWVYADHWHYNDGGKAIIGRYDENGNEVPDIYRKNMGRDQGQWYDILSDDKFFVPIRDGYMEGIMFGPAPDSSDPTYYGYHRGNTQTYEVRIRGKYYK